MSISVSAHLNAPISTFPAAMVRMGSTTTASHGSWYCWLVICRGEGESGVGFGEGWVQAGKSGGLLPSAGQLCRRARYTSAHVAPATHHTLP